MSQNLKSSLKNRGPMHAKLLNPLFVLSLMLVSCQTGNIKKESSAGYYFTSPDAMVILPAVLHEISGLVYIDSVAVACVQDEAGIVFIYDLVLNQIIKELPFSSKGDYEGIAKSDSCLYVLRSDGTLYEISDPGSDEIAVKKYKTEIPFEDNEGLCYDGDNNRLLIACKDKVAKGFGSKDKRYIFGFDLKSKTLTEEPVFTFEMQKIIDFAVENKVSLPMKTKKKSLKSEPDLKFRPSGIDIQPVTNDLYVLSSDDRKLFIFSSSGSIKNIVSLDPALFNQPEGITFLKNRDLLISNEGQNRNPTLLRFNYRE